MSDLKIRLQRQFDTKDVFAQHLFGKSCDYVQLIT